MLTFREPYVNELLVLWLRFEAACVQYKTKPEKKQALKNIKTKFSSVLNSDKVNVDLYCAFVQTVYELDSYKAAQKILEMLKANFKFSLQLTLTCMSIALKESFKKGDSIGCQAINEMFDGDNMGKLHDLVQVGSRQVDAHFLARPMTSEGGEMVARASMEAWHVYFAEKSPENAFNFLDFVISKVPQTHLAELLHHVRVDMMLFAEKFNSSAGSFFQRALGEGLAHSPTHRHLLHLLMTSRQVSMNVASGFWRAATSLTQSAPVPFKARNLFVALPSILPVV